MRGALIFLVGAVASYALAGLCAYARAPWPLAVYAWALGGIYLACFLSVAADRGAGEE